MWYVNSGFGAYMGDRIADDPEISDRPSPRHVYKNGSWALQPWYDWQGLKNAMRGTVFFALAFGTTNANAFALLNSTFNSLSSNEGRLLDLTFAIAQVRLGMTVDYTEAQLTELRGLLAQYGFPIFL